MTQGRSLKLLCEIIYIVCKNIHRDKAWTLIVWNKHGEILRMSGLKRSLKYQQILSIIMARTGIVSKNVSFLRQRKNFNQFDMLEKCSRAGLCVLELHTSRLGGGGGMSAS